MKTNNYIVCTVLFLLISQICFPGINHPNPEVPVGWANNSINTVVFRKNSLVTYGNTQIMAYYNPEGYLCLAKRMTGSHLWDIKQTPFTGNVRDAHNSASIMIDGDGYLHVAWDHHGTRLRYTKSKQPLSLELEEKQPMDGIREDKVTYPEFYKINEGNLIFIYRDGSSGKGNLVMKKYITKDRKWLTLHENLIDGEGQRNAYWQACTDTKGTIHLSWVWRESPNVESNHDMCYARSEDGGLTWENSRGKKYVLPITVKTAEYAMKIPQNSELINQTSMTTDEEGSPYIATYFRMQDSPVPQYHVIYLKNGKWGDLNSGFRKTPFSLKGTGTKQIPVSRPQILAWNNELYLLFRDEERGKHASMAVCTDPEKNRWTVNDLTSYSLGDWEPTYDTELWKEKKVLNLFCQRVEQTDSEGISDVKPQPIEVLEVIPGYRLVWSDEFDYEGKPDPESWIYETGFERNEELQWYQQDNAWCRDGVLMIEGRKEQVKNPDFEAGSKDWRKNREYAEYTSGCIKSRGKKEFLYGRFEIRAKIPTASGSWPAIWTLGKSMPWPSNGEIDIMEYYKIKGVPHILANTAWGTDQRYHARWNTQTVPFSKFTEKDPQWADKFHIWRMDWEEEVIRLYLDDELLNETWLKETNNGSIGNYTNPFRQPHYILLNLAIGKQGGTPDDPAFPLRYEVDYVRVYQKNK
ncbi:MAG: BNR-4 repeat-containing protein [Dysgonamonadaceae bacterium]|nr:BNR-4 repeat-containing protein [Dysgonamonadaceae bacterium]